MLNKINKLSFVVSQPRLLKQLLMMGTTGYLSDIGWVNSFISQTPVDKEGEPIPWVTYSFLDFISDKLDKSLDLLEYGAGNSTLWYATRVKSVISIEHDKRWVEEIRRKSQKNVEIIYQELVYDGEYASIQSRLNQKFDIIIVDGRDRVNCLINSIDAINAEGVVVLDDSEREEYSKGVNILLEHGFKKIDFWGISPGCFYNKCTTLFYRQSNWVGI